MGMIRVQDPARIVVAEDGSTQVVGVPLAAAHPVAPAPAVPATPAATPPADSQIAADAEAEAGAPGTEQAADQGTGNRAAQVAPGQAGAGNEDGNTAQAPGGAG
jgi:cell division protein FtsI (penicillin-binding protein 3)